MFPLEQPRGPMVIPELHSAVLGSVGYKSLEIAYYRKACTPGTGVLGKPDLHLKFYQLSNFPRPSVRTTLLRLPFPNPTAQVKDIHIFLVAGKSRSIASTE
ncbi:hypothetical protein QCA50_018666 [Cerrena zonata]|uniref:Uncharacterized protein n=1 Tax=Cerrena zonata TaxID=2478898 RepID=A0AAW0FL49_9APHY